MDAKERVLSVDRDRALEMCISAVMSLVEGRREEATRHIREAAALVGVVVREEGELVEEAEDKR